MATSLAQAGASIAIIGRRQERVQSAAADLGQNGVDVLGLAADVQSVNAIADARDRVLDRFGHVDILINAAGGNIPGAAVGLSESVFDLSLDAFRRVTDLNLTGTVIPTLAFAESMTARSRGSVINISSMTAARAVTRVAGYSAAKSAVENFTRWLAVEFARKYGDKVRVNAIAPGFFITEQNRGLLTAEDGSLSDRGRSVIAHTPMGRFGEPSELCGAVRWLCSDASAFVTGAIIPVDGGFGAFSGV